MLYRVSSAAEAGLDVDSEDGGPFPSALTLNTRLKHWDHCSCKTNMFREGLPFYYEEGLVSARQPFTHVFIQNGDAKSHSVKLTFFIC